MLGYATCAFLAPAVASAAAFSAPTPLATLFAPAVDSWSPAPTPAPRFGAMEMFRREVGDNTCGFIGGNETSSITCPISSQVCVTHSRNGVHGCCDDADVAGCIIATACIPSSQISASCNSACSQDNLVTKCSASDAPHCYEWLFVYSSTRTMTQHGCSAIPFTSSASRHFNDTNAAPPSSSSSKDDEQNTPVTVTQTSTPTSAAQLPPPPPPPKKHRNIASIVGATIGACLALTALTLSILFVRYRRRKRAARAITQPARHFSATSSSDVPGGGMAEYKPPHDGYHGGFCGTTDAHTKVWAAPQSPYGAVSPGSDADARFYPGGTGMEDRTYGVVEAEARQIYEAPADSEFLRRE